MALAFMQPKIRLPVGVTGPLYHHDPVIAIESDKLVGDELLDDQALGSEVSNDDIHSMAGLYESALVRKRHPVHFTSFRGGTLAEFTDLLQ